MRLAAVPFDRVILLSPATPIRVWRPNTASCANVPGWAEAIVPPGSPGIWLTALWGREPRRFRAGLVDGGIYYFYEAAGRLILCAVRATRITDLSDQVDPEQVSTYHSLHAGHIAPEPLGGYYPEPLPALP